jgi:hypothetical protein
LIIYTPKTNYAAGERIALEIVLTNGSAHSFVYSSQMPLADYQYWIVGLADKQQAPLTRFGRKLFSTTSFYGVVTSEILPGQTYTNINKAVINQLFDVTIPQEYEVTLMRQAVKSNPVRFSVQPW